MYDFGLIEVVLGVGHTEFAAAGLAESDCYTSVLVEAEFERGCAAIAARVQRSARRRSHSVHCSGRVQSGCLPVNQRTSGCFRVESPYR